MPEQFSFFQRPLGGILGAVALLLLWAFPAMAAMHLDVPARAARGDAIRVQASGDGPARPVTVFWLEREHIMAAQPSGSGWQAEFLLPVPLDSGAKSLVLKARTQDGRQAEARVALFDKKRPVQALRVDKKYVDPPAAVQERIRKDREKAGKALDNYSPERLWTAPFARPVPGGVSSKFGLKRVFNDQPRGVHRGLDLRGAEGTPILACADGRVVLADDLYFSGNAVYIDHGQGVFTSYLHMSRILVRPGDVVRRGQVIGKVGSTGRVTGPHLHLSLIVLGQAVDPEPLLEARPAARR